MARTKSNIQNETKTLRTLRRNRHVEKKMNSSRNVELPPWYGQ